MNRTLGSLSVFAALLVGFGAAVTVEADCLSAAGRPAVEVVGHGWKPHVYSPWLETANWYVEPGGNDVKGFQYRVTVRNGMRQTVRAVEWEYSFIGADGKLVYQHRFISPTKIKPGKTRTLTAFSVKPPTDSISAAGARVVERLAIRAVTLDDDTRVVF